MRDDFSSMLAYLYDKSSHYLLAAFQSAFECMSTLIDTCVDCLDVPTFLDAVVEGLKDTDDIKPLVYQILQRLIVLRPLDVLQSE